MKSNDRLVSKSLELSQVIIQLKIILEEERNDIAYVKRDLMVPELNKSTLQMISNRYANRRDSLRWILFEIAHAHLYSYFRGVHHCSYEDASDLASDTVNVVHSSHSNSTLFTLPPEDIPKYILGIARMLGIRAKALAAVQTTLFIDEDVDYSNIPSIQSNPHSIMESKETCSQIRDGFLEFMLDLKGLQRAIALCIYDSLISPSPRQLTNREVFEILDKQNNFGDLKPESIRVSRHIVANKFRAYISNRLF